MKFFDDINNPDSELVRIMNSLYDGIYIVDPQRKILFWNKAAESMTGYSAAEVIGKSCKDDILNHIDENGVLLCRGDCPILKAFKTGSNASVKVYPKTSSGKRFPVETNISVVRNDAGEIVAAIEIFRDMSHQEEYRIMQEKFNSLIKKYVSTTTFSDIQSRIRGEGHMGNSRIVDITVLYLDVVNFTGFSESTSPQTAVRMLNDLFGVCDVITRECFGDIDKFIGDAIMAVFIDANDAVRSAKRILEKAIPELNALRASEKDQPVAIRIGINSGLVLQGDIGTLDRKDHTVIGDTVNTAARVEKSSLPNRLMITEATLSRLDSDLASMFVFHHNDVLKGKSEPVKLYIMEQ